MPNRILLLRSRLDHFADARNIPAFIGCELQTKLFCICYYIKHPAPGDIHSDNAKLRNLYLDIEMNCEGGDIFEGNLCNFSIFTLCLDSNQSCWGFEDKFCDRFFHWKHA